MSRDKKDNVKIWSAVTTMCFGCLLLLGGFIVPPTGEIHESVLVAYGEIMTFVGSVLGIDYVYGSKLKDFMNKEKENEKR